MDHPWIDEQQIVDRYLMGRLPADEARRFEEHYLHCQQCLDQLEVAERLQRALRQAAADDAGWIAAAGRAGLAAWLARAARRPRIGLRIAALLLVAALPAGLAIVELRGVSAELDETRAAMADLRRRQAAAVEPQINTAVLSLGAVRGAGPGPGEPEPSHVVTLAGRAEWLVLALELDGVAHDSYRVTLSRGDREVWTGEGLEPDHRDSLVLSLHSSWLTAGDYVARVEASTVSGKAIPVARFSFRVIAGG